MSHDACSLPARDGDDEHAIVLRLVAARRIAIVGLSHNPARPSYEVARYLIHAGKEIVPVNPLHQKLLGLRSYASLDEIPGPIDLVNIFRRPEHCADVVRSAIAIGANGVWLQSGITSAEARHLAERAGLDYVEDRCLMIEHMHVA